MCLPYSGDCFSLRTMSAQISLSEVFLSVASPEFLKGYNCWLSHCNVVTTDKIPDTDAVIEAS